MSSRALSSAGSHCFENRQRSVPSPQLWFVQSLAALLVLQPGQDKEVALASSTPENPLIEHKCIIPGGTGWGGWMEGGGQSPDTSNIIKVLSYNPIRSRVRLRQSASPSKLLVFFVAIAVIEAALRRDDAVYLRLGGQEERNWLTMITLWLIRLRAHAEYSALITPSQTKGTRKASNHAKRRSQSNLIT